MGCCVCLFHLRIEGSDAEIHHLVAGSKRLGEMFTIPLCDKHHRNGSELHPSRHSDRGAHGGKFQFEQAYGTEFELLEKCEAWIDGRDY